eukprot:TRINITY_DN2790_c0_g1_i11.p1 TRINITY_DN2790_c0_g1~~TRINITY_DN2790_c0_g1_i11.p1  ORF type:complete len:484 (-),score=77.83 TRINITY_DN2790_c0_g1_i11:146-1534(-)
MKADAIEPLAVSTSSSVASTSDELLTAWQKFRRPHPAWAGTILFLNFWNTTGAVSVFQGIADDFYGDNAEWWFNIPTAIQAFFSFLMVPMLGCLSDRYGRRGPLLFVTVLFAVPFACLAIFDLTKDAESYKFFLYTLALSGFGGGCQGILGLGLVYIADTSPPERRAAVTGLTIACCASPAWVFAPIFWSFCRERGLQFFVTMLLICILVQVCVPVVIPESNLRSVRESQPPVTLKQMNPFANFRLLVGGQDLPSTGIIRNLFLVILTLYIMKMGFINSLGLFAEEQFNFDVDQRSYLQTTYGAFQGVGQLCIGAITRFASKQQSVTFGVAMGLIACIIPAVPGIPGGFLFVSEAFLAVSFIAFTVCCTVATEVVPPAFVGEAASVINSALVLCASMGPLVFGILAKAFLKTAYPGGFMLIFAVFVVLSALFTFRIPSDEAIAERRREMRQKNDEVRLAAES